MADVPLQILVVGAGPAAEMMHLPVLAKLRDRGEIALALVCDIHEERAIGARRKFGFRENCGDAVTALERNDIDVVYIFGSAQLHYEYGLRALRSSKHLFVEKPIAPSFANACEMAEIASANSLIAVGGHNRRFYKSIAAIRARAGATRWRYAEAVFHKAEFGNAPPFGAKTWLGANGIHALDALVFAMGGLPDDVASLAGTSGAERASAFSAIMRWHDGAQGVFLCNNNAGARREDYMFHGFGETVRVTDAGLTIEKNGTPMKKAFSSIGDGVTREHEAFLEAIRTGEKPCHNIGALAPSLHLAELIESGFIGRVQMSKPAAAQTGPSPRHAAKSILVVSPDGLEATLASIAANYRFVSLEDIRASDGLRPDIHAAVMGRGSIALPKDVLEKMPELSVVGIAALSLARHDPETLLARNIAIVNASASYAESVAEFALGLAILGRRRAFASDAAMHRNGWRAVRDLFGRRVIRGAHRWRPLLRKIGQEQLFQAAWRGAKPLIGLPDAQMCEPRELKGATAGLIGWGASAHAFAKRLVGAGAYVRVYSEHAREGEIQAAGALPASLGEALASDIVSLHRGLTRQTRHFLDTAALDKLRPGALLINIARGALIEPHALLARLRRGDIFACLDTFEIEPLPASDQLRKLQNVFLTAHIAGGSRDMHEAAAQEVIRKVLAFLEGTAIELISRERLSTMT